MRSCRRVLCNGLVSCLLEDGDLMLKNVGEFMCNDDLSFYINCVHL